MIWETAVIALLQHFGVLITERYVTGVRTEFVCSDLVSEEEDQKSIRHAACRHE
jgi:hypothetical protein